jgi:hypothetical protein
LAYLAQQHDLDIQSRARLMMYVTWHSNKLVSDRSVAQTSEHSMSPCDALIIPLPKLRWKQVASFICILISKLQFPFLKMQIYITIFRKMKGRALVLPALLRDELSKLSIFL